MIVGSRIDSRGFIFCRSCYEYYFNDVGIPETVKNEFVAIHKKEKWTLGPYGTECCKEILH